MVLDGQKNTTTQTTTPKLRSACNSCRQLKVRCSGGNPCQNCATSNTACGYGVSNRLGRPRGAKNRQPSKGQLLAPAPTSSVVHDGQQTPTSANTPVWLSPSADKPTFVLDSWQPTTTTVNHQERQREQAHQHQHHQQEPQHSQRRPQYPGQHTLELPEWPSPLELLDSMSCMGSGDHGLFELDHEATAALSWTPSPNDLPCFFGTNTPASYAAPSHAGIHGHVPGSSEPPSGKGWPALAMEPPTPPVSTADLVDPRLITSYTPAGRTHSQYGDLDPTSSSSSYVATSDTGSSNSNSRHPTGLECSCLQRHMDLLCSLKRPHVPHRSSGASTPRSITATALPVDFVLQNAQEAWHACRAAAECQETAEDNHDHEVIELLVMCLRAVVAQVQQLPAVAPLANFESSAGASGGDDDDDARSLMHLRKNGGGGGGYHHGHDDASSSVLYSRESSSSPEDKVFGGLGRDGVPILVGEFEVSGDDKDLLLRSLRMIALRKLASGLRLLRGIVDAKKATLRGGSGRVSGSGNEDRPPRMANGLHDAGDLKHVERMMDGLMHSIKVLMGLRDVDREYLGL
ncbi:hypothetical protein B0J18DRAFT_174161 [Chaetomium sp. MPI-SDFR-AT-0129]|nr:hypothetical protein B0J18DRAFT_174161 [Chaetomium sp. MPI-SDFR-AT-0129]